MNGDEGLEGNRPDRLPAAAAARFCDPDWTAKGQRRAMVRLAGLQTLWINTGSLCNIECAHCYINSGPRNDHLAFFRADQASDLFDEIKSERLGVEEIGFTGGEPFVNPQITSMISDALERGFRVLVLTNAMKPMQRPKILKTLQKLHQRHGNRLKLRVSLDHYSPRLHDKERGEGSFSSAIKGIGWLVENGFDIQIAGRANMAGGAMQNESEAEIRRGFDELFRRQNWPLQADEASGQLILFPEMDGNTNIPEISTACWGIVGTRPENMMCASSRMAVLKHGHGRPAIMPCTLIATDERFKMGHSLSEAMSADGGMFENGAIKLCHPHCAKFCVLGGGSCSR